MGLAAGERRPRASRHTSAGHIKSGSSSATLLARPRPPPSPPHLPALDAPAPSRSRLPAAEHAGLATPHDDPYPERYRYPCLVHRHLVVVPPPCRNTRITRSSPSTRATSPTSRAAHAPQKATGSLRRSRRTCPPSRRPPSRQYAACLSNMSRELARVPSRPARTR